MGAAFVIPERVACFALEARGAAGADWLARLPALVDACAARWGLALDAPFAGLSINYVRPCHRAGGAAVLKICFPDAEFATEVEALCLFDSRGAVRLLEADPAAGAMLLERLQPGTPLERVTDDRQATSIAVDVMRRLWQPAAAEHAFPTVERWVLAMRTRGPQVLARDPDFPRTWVERALGLYDELSAAPGTAVLLHGDLHHANILTGRDGAWLAIDPKGVVGPPIWETGPLLINALPEDLEPAATHRVLAQRTEQLAAELGVDHAELLAWGVVRAVLSAYWSVEDHGGGWQETFKVAEILDTIHPV